MSPRLEIWKTLERALGDVYAPCEVTWLLGEFRALERSRRGDEPEDGAVPRRLPRGMACLISYADSVVRPGSGCSPLQVLRETVEALELAEDFPALHLLPFYPWDTDRGFSVEDYRQVASENGSWEDVAALGDLTALMFDFVANHASVANPLVQGALISRHLSEADPRRADHEAYRDFVLAYSRESAPPPEDLAQLARPRAAPVLTPYQVWGEPGPDGSLEACLGEGNEPFSPTAELLGEGLVWTTFSRGVDAEGREQTRQVDLNFRNPAVLLEVLRILLFYVDRGAKLIRLDAIGYLWKMLGSRSLHEPGTHRLLVALQALMELLVPEVVTIAEVNEPQAEVFRYLGSEAEPESDLVYQFTHFPLAVHAVLTGEPRFYQEWLGTLDAVGGRQFVTVLGSHDGLGMKPVRGLLPEEEIEALLAILVDSRGGLPNYAVLPGGKRIVYEVCGTPWSLLNGGETGLDPEQELARYLLVVALGLAVRGLPAFYLNGILGRSSYLPEGGLDENRSANREQLDAELLTRSLSSPESRGARVLEGIRELLRFRRGQPALAPDAPPVVPLEVGDAPVIAVLLPARDGERPLLLAANVFQESCTLELSWPPRRRGRYLAAGSPELVHGSAGVGLSEGKLRLQLPGYGIAFLAAEAVEEIKV